MNGVEAFKRGRHRLRKKKEKEGDGFIVSNEEYRHSSYEEFNEAEVSDDSSSGSHDVDELVKGEQAMTRTLMNCSMIGLKNSSRMRFSFLMKS